MFSVIFYAVIRVKLENVLAFWKDFFWVKWQSYQFNKNVEDLPTVFSIGKYLNEDKN